MGEVLQAVSINSLTLVPLMAGILWLFSQLGKKEAELCNWCDTAPVAEGWRITCAGCTYICEDCKQVTPLENGGDEPVCDECWVKTYA